MRKKVAVIVPVYNVEQYLPACVESLLDQTVDDYNIYLIDDGSTDSSGCLCDSYAERHCNVKVLHKKNGGLSDARNFGVENVSEPVVTFVDSDDTVRNDYVEKLLYAMDNGGVDVSVAKYVSVKQQVVGAKKNEDNAYSIIENEHFLKESLLGNKGSLSACGKLFKRSLLLNNPFPEGELYEDMGVLFNIFSSIRSVAFVDQNLYYYLTRDGSIVQSRITKKHKFGIYSCIKMLNSDYAETNPEIKKYIKCRIIKQACGHLPNLVRYADKRNFVAFSTMVRPFLRSVVFGVVCPLKIRVLAVSFYMKPSLGLWYASILFGAKRLMSHFLRRDVV